MFHSTKQEEATCDPGIYKVAKTPDLHFWLIPVSCPQILTKHTHTAICCPTAKLFSIIKFWKIARRSKGIQEINCQILLSSCYFLTPFKYFEIWQQFKILKTICFTTNKFLHMFIVGDVKSTMSQFTLPSEFVVV